MHSRTTSIAYGNGAGVSFDYEPDDDLKTLTHAFASGGEALPGGGTGLAFDYAYTAAAGKLKTATPSTAGLLWKPPGTQSIAYAVNALNQVTTVTTDSVPASITHDLNGNLTGDGANTFTYDAENKLLTAAKGSGASITYEYGPMGRRARTTVDGVTTDFVYDADQSHCRS